MPELPEVETIRRDLQQLVVGRRIVTARLLDEKALTGGSKRAFARRLKGRRITALDRCGKVLIIYLDNDTALLVHFRMTGRLYPPPPDADLPTHSRAFLTLDNGRRLIFEDLRRFGTLEILPADKIDESVTMRKIGCDALDSALTADMLLEMAQRHRVSIKEFLLDQTHLAGVGNIYASEALFRGRIHPQTPACEVKPTQMRLLLKALRETLREAIKYGGTTVSDYVTGQGVPGGFQRRLRVYGREGERCRRRGCDGAIQRIVQGQRSTFYCPACQKRSCP